MKFLLVYLMAMALNLSSRAQSSFSDSIARARNQVTRAGMLTLGGWAVANITSGFIIAGERSGITKYAWQMNAYWNFVNLGLAGMGYLHAIKEAHQSFSLLGNYDAQNALEKTYIFNVGLDLAYLGGGLYLRERGLNSGKVTTAQQLQGYGISIIIQGSFLLLEDATMIYLHKRNTARVRHRLQETAIR